MPSLSFYAICAGVAACLGGLLFLLASREKKGAPQHKSTGLWWLGGFFIVCGMGCLGAAAVFFVAGHSDIFPWYQPAAKGLTFANTRAIMFLLRAGSSAG